MTPNDPTRDPDELAALIDSLVAAGSQHINLEVGEQTRVQTVSSTDCCKPGACAQPTPQATDEDL